MLQNKDRNIRRQILESYSQGVFNSEQQIMFLQLSGFFRNPTRFRTVPAHIIEHTARLIYRKLI